MRLSLSMIFIFIGCQLFCQQITYTTLDSERRASSSISMGTKAIFAGGIPVTQDIDIYDSESKMWSKLSMSEAKYGMSLAEYNDQLIVVGGFTRDNGGTLSNQIEIINIVTGESEVHSMPEPRADARLWVRNDELFIINGALSLSSNANSILKFDLINHSFQSVSSCCSRRNPAILQVDSLLYIAGGGTGGTDITILNLNTFQSSTEITTDNFFYNQIWHVNDKVIFLSGISSFGGYENLLVCDEDLSDCSFEFLSEYRNSVRAFEKDGDIWVCGGFSDRVYRSEIDRFNIELDTRTTYDLPVGRIVRGEKAEGNYLLFPGGFLGSRYYDQVDVFNLETEEFISKPLTREKDIRQTRILNNHAFFIGSENDGNYYEEIDILDLSSLNTSQLFLSEAKTFFPVVQLERAIVMVGGWTGTNAVNTAEVISFLPSNTLIEKEDNQIALVQNPAFNYLMIDSERHHLENGSFNIIDMQGRNVLSAIIQQGKTKIDISCLPAGTYSWLYLGQLNYANSGRLVIGGE